MRQYIIGLSKLSFETQREGQTRWTQKSISRLITQSERTCCHSENWQGVGMRQYLSICLWCPPKTIVSDTSYTRQPQIRLFSPDQAWRIRYTNCLTEIERRKDNQCGHLKENMSHWKPSEQIKCAPIPRVFFFLQQRCTFISSFKILLKLRLNKGSLKHAPPKPLQICSVGEREKGWHEESTVAMFLLLLCRLHLNPASELLLIWSTLVLH